MNNSRLCGYCFCCRNRDGLVQIAGMKSKRLLFQLAFCASIILLTVWGGLTQFPPTARAATSTPILAAAPSAVMAFCDGSTLQIGCKNSRFPKVMAPPGQPVNISLQFSVSGTNNHFSVEPLDGGTMPTSQSDSILAAGGTASIQYQPGTQPGLYRVLLRQGSDTALLQFWVSDPNDPISSVSALHASAAN